MSKSLHTIQVLAKTGKILSKIVFICCLVGGIGCCVGLAALLGLQGLVIGGVDVTGLIVERGDTPMSTLLFACVSGFIACAAECVLSKFAEHYFRHELEAGTPFTLAGARQIRRLGILTIALPVGALILQQIVYGVFRVFDPMTQQWEPGNMLSVGMGILFLVASVIFQYGAELTQPNGPACPGRAEG